MIMKIVMRILIVMFLPISIGLPLRANAVSPSPIPGVLEERTAQGIKVKGETVCLFQSGTADVKKAISVNDVLPVYRESESHEFKEVGKIKVLSYAGEDYLKGEVVEGELKVGDIAKKGDAASLIVSEKISCK